MGIAKLYGQKASGTNINGIIKDYYAYAGENISAGDLVEYINGVASSRTETSTDTVINKSAYKGFSISAIKLDEDRVFVAHSDSSNYYLYGVVLTINGVTITVGTDTQLSTTANSARVFVAKRLLDGRIFIAYARVSNSYKLYGMLVSADGTALTVLDDRALSGKGNDAVGLDVTVIDNNQYDSGYIFVAHSAYDYSILYGMVCYLVNGNNTISYGTDTELAGNYHTGRVVSATSLPYDSSTCSGKVFIAHSYASSDSARDKVSLKGIVCTIQGTTISKGTDTELNSGAYSGCKISTSLLENGNVLVANSYGSSYYLYGIVVTINGTTIAKGTNTSLVNLAYAGYAISTHLLNNGNVFIAHCYDSSNYYLYGIIVTVNGTTITAGTDTQLSSTAYTGYAISALLLNNGRIFIAHSYSASYHLYAQIFDVANNVPTNQLTINEYETQVRKTTTSKFDGVAKTSGVGSTTTAPKDYVSIYTL